MRRVVVTGLGLLSPFGVGVEHGWKRAPCRQERRPARRPVRGRRSCLQDRLSIPRGDGTDGTFNPDDCAWSRRNSARSATSSSTAIAAADEALEDAGWEPKTDEDQIATGVLIGSGIGGIDGIAENALILQGARPAPHQPVLHSRQHHQSGLRPGFDPPRAARARTTPSSPPARPARTPSATRRG